ncbi:hypothetical protein AVEN_192510-1 [Araneus ventricosus]|uniref:Transmembrane protein n=1 Tax=Araneus ventricosus TaxID=182803 RepID=A0A4Y2PM23_ARAVE|nr:hypothetical protein AVEN_192510-1 [Araneus ventricosus]
MHITSPPTAAENCNHGGLGTSMGFGTKPIPPNVGPLHVEPVPLNLLFYLLNLPLLLAVLLNLHRLKHPCRPLKFVSSKTSLPSS